MLDYALIGAGFLFGLVTSLHCIGMCGPIALALPVPRSEGRGSYLLGRILYNSGRMITYAVLGGIFGLLGKIISLAGWQQALSIGAGVFILLWVLLPQKYLGKLSGIPGLGWIYTRFKRLWAPLIREHTQGGMLTLGVLNGLLPCGMVYAALAGAARTGSIPGGVAFMALFGLGTMATMLPISLAGRLIKAGARSWYRRLVPAAAIVVAVLFILRGLALGIPFVSPDLNKKGGHMHDHQMPTENSEHQQP